MIATCMYHQIKQWAKTLKKNIVVVWLVAKGERTPVWIKILALITAAYALSPIDLIPDFIPVLGFLDDLSLISWFVGKFHGEIFRFRDWENVKHGQEATSFHSPEQPDAAAQPAFSDATQPSVAELGHS